MIGFLSRSWHRFIGALAEVERETRAERARTDPRAIDWKLIGTISLACVILSLLEYYGSSNHWRSLETPLSFFMDDADEFLRDIFRSGERQRLWRLTYWSGTIFIGYFIIPVLWIKFVLKGSLREFGLSFKGTWKHMWIYVAMYLVVLPFVIAVAFTESFQKTYPFYENAHRSLFDFFSWQVIYTLQFFSLEFFYRGFLIHGTRHKFGLYAILLPVVPYCMIHFGKPLPETIGAIIAGLALGVLSVLTRNIWLGVAIHVSVAITMDVLSLWVQGKIF